MGQVFVVLGISQNVLMLTAQSLELGEPGTHWTDMMCDLGQVVSLSISFLIIKNEDNNSIFSFLSLIFSEKA